MQTGPVQYARRFVRTAVRRTTRLAPLAFLAPPSRRPGSRPVLGVVGFYGHGNYGDELFLEVFREHLGSSFELRSILDPGQSPISRFLGAGIRDAEAILIGGGDLLKPWSNASRYWDTPYLRRPVFVAGVGVPLWGSSVPAVVDALGRFFRDPAIRFVGARDAESTAWIEANLRPTAPLVTSPDLVCGLTLPPVEKPDGPPIFGVAVRSREEPDDLTNVRLLCERAMALGYRVRRIILATGSVRKSDQVATDRLGLPDTELVSSDDLDVISRAIGECTAIASMKFHGVIVAAMYGVPAIALMPTTKTRNFMRDIGRSDLVAAHTNPALPTFLKADIAPIDQATRTRLRTDAVAHLADLCERIRAATTESAGPA